MNAINLPVFDLSVACVFCIYRKGTA